MKVYLSPRWQRESCHFIFTSHFNFRRDPHLSAFLNDFKTRYQTLSPFISVVRLFYLGSLKPLTQHSPSLTELDFFIPDFKVYMKYGGSDTLIRQSLSRSQILRHLLQPSFYYLQPTAIFLITESVLYTVATKNMP